MSIIDIIDRRIMHWQNRLARAEGELHSENPNITEERRAAMYQQCRLCSSVIVELRGIREEVKTIGEKN